MFPTKKSIDKNLEAIRVQFAKIEAEQKKLDKLIDRRKQLLWKLGIPVKTSQAKYKKHLGPRDITEVHISRNHESQTDDFTFNAFPITVGSRRDSDLATFYSDLKDKKVFGLRRGYFHVAKGKLNYTDLVDPNKNQKDLDVGDEIAFDGFGCTRIFVLTILQIIRV